MIFYHNPLLRVRFIGQVVCYDYIKDIKERDKLFRVRIFCVKEVPEWRD